MEPKITAQSAAMVVLLGLTWGCTFLVIELALIGITPVWLAAGRLGFAAILMIAVMAWRRKPLFLDQNGERPWGLLITVSLLSSIIPFLFLNWGQQHVTSGFAGISMAAVALIVLPLAHFLVPGERITYLKTAGFLVGFIGICVLVGGRAFDSSGSEYEYLGRAACLCTAFCYGISSVLMRRLPRVDPISLAGVILFVGAICAFPLALLVEGVPNNVSRETLFWIALLGLVPTAGANVLRVLVIHQAGPVFMSITNYIVPVISVFAGWWFLSEPMPQTLLLAMVLVLGGVGLSQYRAFARLFSRA